ncbi:hypothetical protein, partial [Candidatus Albibeggiatoa sp. nov. NOAA]|uniref:hypothetical protein n=1 Tax=Candidatus Albibeggiatoa sp. nov. NOAA TaxID=3162724 RepID=UPI0032F849F1|nr:hypothetical protein [Thiotrichaceae bacterium]
FYDLLISVLIYQQKSLMNFFGLSKTSQSIWKEDQGFKVIIIHSRGKHIRVVFVLLVLPIC